MHQRFARPQAWLVFLAHVRRGGYARELKEPAVKSELAKYRVALQHGSPLPDLSIHRTYPHVIGDEWFARLTVDPARLTQSQSRPRP
jgi:hypothetical protein